jgi:hypothetical protein
MSNKSNDIAAGFGLLLNAMGGGGNKGNSFPEDDAIEMSKGARFIPHEVTDERRLGKDVKFNQVCGPCCWYWEFSDGKRIYHFDRSTYDHIAHANGKTEDDKEKGDAGPCPNCGNIHTNGGTVLPEEEKAE